MRVITTIALVLLIVGGLNWLVVGLAEYDLVAALFGGQTAILSRVVYVIVGISAIIVLLRIADLLADPDDRSHGGTSSGGTGSSSHGSSSTSRTVVGTGDTSTTTGSRTGIVDPLRDTTPRV